MTIDAADARAAASRTDGRSGARVRGPEDITLRRVDIDFDRTAGGKWIVKDKRIECLLNTLSFMLPPGERFFIQSLRESAQRVTDPDLKEEMRRFIFQEAMHCRQHDAANRLLQGYYRRGAAFERFTGAHLNFWGRMVGRAGRLAGTCAIEHFTASAARTLLQNQEFIEPLMDQSFYRLWVWHAVEESEHKSVCFDVYRASVGTGVLAYLQRISIFVLTSVMFLATLLLGLVMLGLRPRPASADAAPGSSSEASPPPTPAKRLKLSTLLKLLLPWRQYFAYFRPSFHPSDYDCSDIIEHWKARFPNFDGRDPVPDDAPSAPKVSGLPGPEPAVASIPTAA